MLWVTEASSGYITSRLGVAGELSCFGIGVDFLREELLLLHT